MGEHRKTNSVDSSIFWIASYATPTLWLVLAVVSVLSLKLQQVTICAVGVVLSGVNLLGYIKCEKNHKSYVKGFLFNQAKQRMTAEDI